MIRILTRFTFTLIFYSVFYPVFAQGSWQPLRADLSYPRTLLKAAEIPAVQQSLLEPERQFIYELVYGWAIATPPAAASPDDTDRRLRARSAKNQAFVRLMDRKPGSNGLEMLSPAEKAKFETDVISLLETLNSDVGTPYGYEKWQWRSKELIDYLVAYDLLLGAGVPPANLQTSKARLQEFAGKLYGGASQNAFLAGIFLNTYKNNHLLMTAAALGMAGVVLNDATSSVINNQPVKWIGAGMYAIDNVMWHDAKRQSIPGEIAGYAEGPYYFKYAMLNLLPFFRAMGNFLPDDTYSFTWGTATRQIRNPYFDPNYDLLYQWMTEITMPDGRFPALEDSYVDMGMPELALTGKPQFVKPFYGQNLETNQPNSLNSQLDGTVDLRANYLAANVRPQALPTSNLTALPTAGNLIFRSGTGFKANYLHVYGKNGPMLSNSGGHNQGDASSFILYAHGQLLALDAGYLKSDRRTEVGNPTNHNLVLVDGTGPLIGAPSVANDAPAYIQNVFETPGLSYGEVQTNYVNSSITRKTLSIRGEYYLMADFISAPAVHNFTWQLHGFGLENGTTAQGVFSNNTANHEGTWQKNGVSLKAHVTAADGATGYTTATGLHETTWNTAGNHTTLLVKKDNVAETQFLAALSPYTTPNSTTTTLALPGMAGLITTAAAYTDLVFTKADTLLKTVTAAALPQPLSSDANLTFYAVTNNLELSQAFLQNGTRLMYGTQELIKSNRRANLVWEQPAPGEFSGFVSKPATLLVQVKEQPVAVSGQNLASWSYNAVTGILTATFTNPSDFQFKTVQEALPVELTTFTVKKAGTQAVLKWQTASEKNNAGFEIQFAPDGRTWKTLGFQAGKVTANQLTTYEFKHKPNVAGQLYYRLAQHDLDGRLTYSAVKTLWLEAPKPAALHVYPNPARQSFMLELPEPLTQPAGLVFYNAAGVPVHQQMLAAPNHPQALKVTLPATLPAGLYQVQVQTAQQRYSFRLQKQQ